MDNKYCMECFKVDDLSEIVFFEWQCENHKHKSGESCDIMAFLYFCLNLFSLSRGVRPPFGMVRARGRGRSAAGSRAAGNKGVYLPSPGGYSFNGFRSYYPAVRGGWYGDGYSKRGGRQEVCNNLVFIPYGSSYKCGSC